MKVLISKWMLGVAAVFLLAGALFLVKGEWLTAVISVLLSVGALDSYRRDKRKLERLP
jgi:uncharacterized membrane protein YjjP (DUF1212 family)